MEEKINVAEILKNKPQETKLYDLLYNIDVELDTISTTDTETVVWCTNETDNNTTCHRGYSEFGTVRGCSDGLQILLPSKSMRDWRKFNWKKGDVLISNDGKKEVFFNGFTDDTYALFKAKHGFEILSDGNTIYLADEDGIATSDYALEDKDVAQTYINTIEERLGGKLNLETLEVEKPQPEFKDGDMVSLEIRYIDSEDVIVETYIVHGDYNYGEELNFHAGCNNLGMIKHNSCVKPTNTSVRNVFVRYATDSEKQQLFSALAKENKAWDSEKKEVVNLKPKVKLKPFDKVLVRDSKSDNWRANLFGYIGKDGYYRCVYANWVYCIPYAGNEHLLGTTNNVEG
uniref:hypothetical protein n=1 Tax=Prevotella sp. TaxID=59823 RepID=UPI0040272619